METANLRGLHSSGSCMLLQDGLERERLVLPGGVSRCQGTGSNGYLTPFREDGFGFIKGYQRHSRYISHVSLPFMK